MAEEEPKIEEKPFGRPVEYGEHILTKAKEYIAICIDEEVEKGTEDKPIYSLKVKLPTKGGLAVYLGVSRDTLYDWSKKYPDFSYIMEQLGALQEERLIDNGLSGSYNSTIAKVLLTKHGYREGIEASGKDGTPLIPLADDKKKALDSLGIIKEVKEIEEEQNGNQSSKIE